MKVLRGGADINAADNKAGETALHKSTKMGRIEAVRLLLRAGCNIALKTKGGESSGKVKGGKNAVQMLWDSTKIKASRKAQIADLLEHP